MYTAAGNTVYVVWLDKRSGFESNLLSKSTNGGSTFSSPARIDPFSKGTDTSIAVSGNNVYVVWEEWNPFGSIVRFFGSTDGGSTFAIRNSLGCCHKLAYVVALEPQIAAIENRVQRF